MVGHGADTSSVCGRLCPGPGYNTACETVVPRACRRRVGLRAHDRATVGLSAIPRSPRGRRRQHRVVRGLAEQFRLNAAQIRKDLAQFGEFGVRGVGYYVKDLRRHLREILGLDRQLKVVILGAGNLGLALADYPGFRHDGFDVVALLDTARDKVGQYSRSGVPIRHARELERLAERERLDIAVLAVPAESAQEVVDAVVGAGVKAILNFTPGSLRVPKGVKLKNVDLTVSLESLSFFLARGVDVPEVP